MAKSGQSTFIWYEHMTQDLDKAVRFYGQVVGWDIRDSGMPGMRYLLFGKGGKDVGGMVSWSSIGTSKPPQWAGHLFTPDVDAEAAAVTADGGNVLRPPQDIPGVGRFAVVADPQGVEYLLFTPLPTDPPARLGPTEVGNIGWRELVTTDWEGAWAFYSAHYGWQASTAVDMGSMGTYQTFMLNDADGGGMMSQPPGDRTSLAWTFYFVVDDIQAAAQRIAAQGGQVTAGPHQVPGGAWILHGLDDQNGRFALTASR